MPGNPWARAAVGGAIAFVIASLVSNGLFFGLAAPVLFDPAVQSAKLLDVLFEASPRPLMFTNGPLYLLIAAGIGVLHGLVFAYIEPVLPRGRIPRGAAYAVVLWVLMALYFEFHAPFNMFREPVALLALELALWAVVVLVEGLLLSWLYGPGRDRVP
ncbi:hypothetical protein KBTX_02079 [wastewater metagenome]|uniref:Transmembrane protein n=2 Tax=unclassified sequences TaxID=12908 RepID=A0A5B8RFY9_9ZZZZ|nr:hypothetical protein [Arhodomonas aquaeolei]QEA05755.1 hypothetical protein KBTEX_02079 [uncultured organism]